MGIKKFTYINCVRPNGIDSRNATSQEYCSYQNEPIDTEEKKSFFFFIAATWRTHISTFSTWDLEVSNNSRSRSSCNNNNSRNSSSKLVIIHDKFKRVSML